MQDNKLIITHQDGSQNVVENPFLPMQATYAALAADPNAMPELSDESRAEILRQIASERRSGKMSDYNNELLNDCAWFAEKHRGKNKQSGPHWSTIIRFTKLFDEAARLQQRVDTLEAYIDDFTPDSMQIAKKTIISKLEGKVNVASDLLESISLWFYKNVGNPDPFWACQFESACKLFENSEEDNNETSNL